jgi:peptide/nickel transport system substrate-binding protein
LADDLSSITLTLRKDVKFIDGSDFNAEVAKWNLDKFIEHKKAGTEYWKSADVIDDYTVRLNLSQYTNTLVSNLAGSLGLMESKVACDTYGEDWLAQHPVGTGPFKFVSLENGVRTFRRNDNYWGKDAQGNQLPYLDGFDTYWIADEMTRYAAVKNGDVDGAFGTGTVIFKNLQAEGYTVLPNAINPLCLWPSSANPDSPWANKLVREAMEYAIDRDAIAKTADGGFGGPAYQLPVDSNAAHNPNLPERRYNVAKAKELLESAGYPDGFTSTLYSWRGVFSSDACVAVQSCAAEIGITLNIQQLDTGAYYGLLQTKGWEGLLFGPVTNYLNFAQGLSTVLGPGTKDYQYNYSVKRPDGYYDLIDQALATREMEPEKEQAVINLLYDDVTCIPVYYSPVPYALPDSVHDTGYLTLSNSLFYTPEKTWMSKK